MLNAFLFWQHLGHFLAVFPATKGWILCDMYPLLNAMWFKHSESANIYSADCLYSANANKGDSGLHSFSGLNGTSHRALNKLALFSKWPSWLSLLCSP